MMTELKVDVNIKALLDEERIAHKQEVERLQKKIVNLKEMLKYERDRREYAEKRLNEIENISETKQVVKKRKHKPEEKKEYSEYTSKGIKKKTKVESIQSYTDFKGIQDYFLKKNDITAYALWTVGVCMGVRISDLSVLKWKNVINDDHSFKQRVKLYEQKTSKLQNCLITEAITKALTLLADDIGWDFDSHVYIFDNRMTGQPFNVSTWYRKITIAAKSCGLNYHVGTHTMRESFANIILCVDNHTIDMNAITKIQGLLNHSDPRITMKYLGKLDELYDIARTTVSDFVLGKSGVDKLICTGTSSISDIMKKLDEIETKFDGK